MKTNPLEIAMLFRPITADNGDEARWKRLNKRHDFIDTTFKAIVDAETELGFPDAPQELVCTVLMSAATIASAFIEVATDNKKTVDPLELTNRLIALVNEAVAK